MARPDPLFPPITAMNTPSLRIVVTVIGHDKVGIIAAVSSLLADAHVNIIDISQTTLREFFTMIMLADLEHATLTFDEIKRRLNSKGEEMGLRIDAQREDVFQYMHRI
jgi:ACT domain-containing protein